jgi:hypothetical protein
LGKPRRWTAAQLRLLSQPTPADIIAAVQQWRKDAPPRFRRLLDTRRAGKPRA